MRIVLEIDGQWVHLEEIDGLKIPLVWTRLSSELLEEIVKRYRKVKEAKVKYGKARQTDTQPA